MTDIEWKQSRITNRGNQYFHYPNDDMEFKNKVASGGWVAHIYKNGIFIDKIEADSSVVWQSPIFTHIKTTTINSKDIEQKYMRIAKSMLCQKDMRICCHQKKQILIINLYRKKIQTKTKEKI